MAVHMVAVAGQRALMLEAGRYGKVVRDGCRVWMWGRGGAVGGDESTSIGHGQHTS